MRFPWQRRADEERQHRLAAEKRLEEARADWFDVEHHAAVLRHERELNGWTATIVSIFGAPRQAKGGQR